MPIVKPYQRIQKTVIFIDPSTYETVYENPNTITLEDQYFKPTTGMDYYDGLLRNPEYYKTAKGVKGKIVYMSPDEYFKASALSRTKPTTAEDEMRNVWNPKVEEYYKRSLAGEKMPILVIDFTHHTQEGRHRAMVAKKLGLKEIPVLVVKET